MERFNCLICAELWQLSDMLTDGFTIPPILRDIDIRQEIEGFSIGSHAAQSKWYRHTSRACATMTLGFELCDFDDEVQAAINLGFKYKDIVWNMDWRDIKQRHYVDWREEFPDV